MDNIGLPHRQNPFPCHSPKNVSDFSGAPGAEHITEPLACAQISAHNWPQASGEKLGTIVAVLCGTAHQQQAK
jgi:hypothetical protein